MKTTPENIEAMADILHDHGVTATVEQIESIAHDFAYHMDMMREMENHRFARPTDPRCDKCIEKDRKIKDLEYENRVYNESVKKRRNATMVYIDNGEVKYDLT